MFHLNARCNRSTFALEQQTCELRMTQSIMTRSH